VISPPLSGDSDDMSRSVRLSLSVAVETPGLTRDGAASWGHAP
jgi:hypothetical protein